jgi:hypothetical protein
MFKASRRLFALPLLAALLAAGCESTPTDPGDPEPDALGYEIFSDNLEVGGSVRFLFSISDASHIKINFAGATAGTPLRSFQPTLQLGFGRAVDEGCAGEIATFPAQPRLTSHLPLYLQAGVYCMTLTDTASALSEPMFVSVRVVQGIDDTAPEPRTETFASNITIAGVASRTFTALGPGQVDVTLSALGTTSGLMAGLGLGVERPDGSGCALTHVVHTAASGSAQISASVDSGRYCVTLFDLGQFTDTTNFSISIRHP